MAHLTHSVISLIHLTHYMTLNMTFPKRGWGSLRNDKMMLERAQLIYESSLSAVDEAKAACFRINTTLWNVYIFHAYGPFIQGDVLSELCLNH